MATSKRPQRRTAAPRGGDERVSMARSGAAARERRPIRTLIVTLVIAAILLVSALVGFLVLSNTAAFTITYIDTEATEHLSKENIGKLASVPEGTTLLNIDEVAIEENLKRNPWVSEVQFVREFPDRLKIVVIERKVDCLVKMNSGQVCWCLGDDNVWIEPINLNPQGNQSVDDVALALAREMGAILITETPASMVPSAGSQATDEVLKAISLYRSEFSEDFASQIACFSASSVESISCTLTSGVEVSLGAPTNIDTKEAVIREILARHPNQVTYINVRIPSQPSYRKVGVESVSEGTGITVDLDSEALDSSTSAGDGASASDDGTSSTEGQGTGETQQYDEYGNPLDGSAVDDGSGYDDYTDDGASDSYDTGDMILGEDGIYYSYEDYYGL